MAEAFLRGLFPGRYEAFSAGIAPTVVHPMAIRVMAEAGIDLTGQRSKGVEEYSDRGFDIVITVCDNAREACPFFSAGMIREHHGFADPASATGGEEARLRTFRSARDEIEAWIKERFGTRE
jgi:arsenate reductase (thioredoxin)